MLNFGDFKNLGHKYFWVGEIKILEHIKKFDKTVEKFFEIL